MRIRIGTRRSAIAKAQADTAIMMLREASPNFDLELYYISTKSDLPDSMIEDGSDEPAISELQLALLDGVIDVAIHDMSQLSPFDVEGLTLAAVLGRADPRDALVTSDNRQLQQLEAHSKIGVDSPRRLAQLYSLRSDLSLVQISQNVETQLKQLRAGAFDGTIISISDLLRLNQYELACQTFGLTEMIPIPGQGAIGLEVREDDPAMLTIVSMVNHEESRLAILAERAFAAAVKPSLKCPVAAYANLADDHLRLVGMVADLNTGSIRRNGLVGEPADAYYLGEKLAEMLKAA